MIDPSIRLRRAINLNDLVLVERIIKNNPAVLRNPDYADRNNTSLHLAASLGHMEIVEYLVKANHEEVGISRNVEGNTPLMEAVNTGKEEAAEFLAASFPRCIDWQNKDGLDALMLSSTHGHTTLLTSLLALYPSPSSSPLPLLTSIDAEGNTALHFASSYGHLKCLRILLSAGADATAANNFGCTPVMASRTKDAQQYFVGLVMEMEKRKGEEREREREMVRRREGGVRVVSPEHGVGSGGYGGGGGGGGGHGGFGSEEEEGDTVGGLPGPREVLGSVDSGRVTPTRMRAPVGGWGYGVGGGGRGRAGSGE